MTAGFKPFPYDAAPYRFAGAALQKAWPRLHQGDGEPFPDAQTIQQAVAHNRKFAPACGVEKAAASLQGAWRAYHQGNFADAVQAGEALGPLGANVANKASNIYATYLETNEVLKLALFRAAAARAEALQAAARGAPNAWYFHAQALGRYSQGISVAKALAEGLATKVRHSLERTLELNANHAEAHIAFGSYHAEIVAKVGGAVAGLTYGANRDEAIAHFDTALRLLPHSAIARIEYANALAMLFGRKRLADARKLYSEAAACLPQDAMERLDVEQAKAELVD